MLKAFVYTIMILFLLEYDRVKGNPILNLEQLTGIKALRNGRTLLPAAINEPRYYYYYWSPWSSLPSFSISSFFKNDDNDLTTLKKKVVELEKSQKEIFELLSEYITASKTQCICSDNVIVATNEQTQTTKDETGGSKGNAITEDKKGEAVKDTKDSVQSVSTAINGDSGVFATAGNVDKEKVDEKEETPAPPAPPKNDDALANASVNVNENRPTEGDGEKGGSTEEPEKMENSGAPEELTIPHLEPSMENEQPGSLEKDTVESNAQAVFQINGTNGIETENHSDKTEENEGTALIASITGFAEHSKTL